VYRQRKKLTKRLRPMTKTASLIEYIDHVIASLNADYDAVVDHTKEVQSAGYTDSRARLEWNVVHIHTSLNALLTDLKRHQEYLRKGMNAGTKVQD
jgi:hypothetical protein